MTDAWHVKDAGLTILAILAYLLCGVLVHYVVLFSQPTTSLISAAVVLLWPVVATLAFLAGVLVLSVLIAILAFIADLFGKN